MQLVKRFFKNLLCSLLERQVRQLRSQHDFKLIAVAGSVGKTSTKMAIATVLGTNARVCYQEGNYNDRLSVPLIFFNQPLPTLWSAWAWTKIYSKNKRIIASDYPYDYVIVELGTDGPGQIARFAYLQPDLAVLTAVADEHMEYFGTLDAVAKEELGIAHYAKTILINRDNTDAHYLHGINYESYGLSSAAEFQAHGSTAYSPNGSQVDFTLRRQILKNVPISLCGKQGLLVALAAAAVADIFGYQEQELRQGISAIRPFAGRMRILSGINESVLIDDTYNASPLAVCAGLDVLYAAQASAKVAILGSMNELGNITEAAHQQVGEYCDPSQLDLVVTIGHAAESFLAPAASARGCQVQSFLDPVDAGRYIAQHLKQGSIILAEGSQNGVFAEEAVKLLLANTEDVTQLVRQSADWIKIKRQQFPQVQS